MANYIINGGNKIDGKLKAESAKNAVLPLLAASILTDEKVVLENCPNILDVVSMVNILTELGVKVSFEEKNIIIDSSSMSGYVISEYLSKRLRSSIFMLGAILSRMGKAEVAYPGGCDIGKRPIDLHLSGLKKLGVEVKEDKGVLICKAYNLRGNKIYLDFPSVGATENIILASVFASGYTEIHNVAREPEIEDLQNFLNKMGAKIKGAGTNCILIEGVKKLHGTTYLPMFDRIEACTYLTAAAITGGSIEISGCNVEKISSVLDKFRDNTCKITLNNDIIYLKSAGKRKCFQIDTLPYPGFPTDLQAQMLALATVSDGISLIRENVFEARFNHVKELVKMGANIEVQDNFAVVKGVGRLKGAKVCAGDLRGGAALVVAGLNAEGETTVCDIKHIERGYADFDKKLTSLGADIKKKI